MDITRKLATIQRIKDIQPIENADAIEVATVNGWKVVVAKNVGHKIGDFVVYCEIDSFLPVRPEFEFLRKSSLKRMNDQEGFKLRTVKLRGQVSQGLILPLSVFSDYGYIVSDQLLNDNPAIILDKVVVTPADMIEIVEGNDVSEALGIVKYEAPIAAELAGKVKGNFPSFLRKTDEERVQNLAAEYNELKLNPYYVTEKLDGSSATFYVKDGVYGICSRNLELAEPAPFVEGTMEIGKDGIERPVKENTFWKVSNQLGIKEKMLSIGKNISIQGELIGEGIQDNPYKLKGQTVKFFNAFDIDKQDYFMFYDFVRLINVDLKLETVPILNTMFTLPDTIDELLAYAEGKTRMPGSEAEREGVVIRSFDRKISFKAISNKFLLKKKEE